MMNPVIRVLVNFMVLGCVLALALTILWGAIRGRIRRNGWDLNRATPITPLQIALLFIPIVGAIWFAIVATAELELARTKKSECGSVTVRIWRFGVTYAEE